MKQHGQRPARNCFAFFFHYLDLDLDLDLDLEKFAALLQHGQARWADLTSPAIQNVRLFQFS